MKLSSIRKGLILLILIIVCAGVAVQAHHIRGIPHYSYKSNYPESPVYEIVESVDQWTVTFTYYSMPGQKALDLAIYIRDTLKEEPYEGAVTFLVFGKHEDPTKSHPYTAYRNPTNIYKVGWVYEEGGDYFVRVSFEDSDKSHDVLFELTVGEENRVWYLLVGAVALVLLFATAVGIVRKKKKKTRR